MFSFFCHGRVRSSAWLAWLLLASAAVLRSLQRGATEQSGKVSHPRPLGHFFREAVPRGSVPPQVLGYSTSILPALFYARLGSEGVGHWEFLAGYFHRFHCRVQGVMREILTAYFVLFLRKKQYIQLLLS